MSRFVALLLGLILILIGVAVAAPTVMLDFLEIETAPEAVEQLRLTAGYGLWALAALVLLAALLWPRRPEERPAGREGVNSPVLTVAEPEPAPFPEEAIADEDEPTMDFVETVEAESVLDDEPPMAKTPAEPKSFVLEQLAEASVEEEPAPAALEGAPEMPAIAEPETPRGFADLRTQLREQARAENWEGAARTLHLMKSAAGDDVERAQAAQDLGVYLRGQGKSADAAAVYDDAVSYARSAGDPALLGDTLIDAGDLAAEARRHDVAVSRYEEALALRVKAATAAPQDLEAARRVTLVLERLGDAWEDKGHGMRALDLYRRSEQLGVRLAAADARFQSDLAATRARLAELEEGPAPVD